MTQKKIKIDEGLHAILTAEKCDRFRMIDLRDWYLARYEPNADPERRIVTRKWLYSQLRRLCKAGLLTYIAGSSRQQARYQKTAQFHKVTFILTKRDVVSGENPAPGQGDHGRPVEGDLLDELRELERQYQVDLLSSIGESEESKRLYLAYPSLKGDLEPQYHQAREHCSKLLGQLKAVKSIIAKQRA